MNETDLIKERYSRRNFEGRYSLLNPDIYLKFQERERKIIRLLTRTGYTNLREIKVLEVGCGTGTNLLELTVLGFSPNNLWGIDLIDERITEAKSRLPNSVKLITGDALEIEIEEKFDIIYLSTVYSSILDDNFQIRLALKIWEWLKPGGGILWYDFIYNNPKNPDVRGIKFATIKKLFPNSKIIRYKITLAPPIAREVVKISRHFYTLLNILLPLRTHLLCWIQKN